jgi:drug/metabolite transporter (DMT)-like permease
MLAANLGMLLVAFSWGTLIPSVNHLLLGWDPFFLALARYGLAAPPLLLVLGLVERDLPLLAGYPAWRWWLLGTVGIGLFPPIFTVGLAHANPITAAILSSTSPAVTAFVGRVAFRLPIPGRMIPGILLAILGCAYATYDPGRAGAPFDLRGGEILILVASGLWAWYSIAVQRWMKGCSQLRITAVTVSAGAPVLLAVYLIAGAFGAAEVPPALPRTGLDLGLFLWLALVPVMLGNLLWHHGVRTLGPVIAALFMNLMPISAVLITVAMGIQPRRQQIVGGIVVLAGIMLAQFRRAQLRRA